MKKRLRIYYTETQKAHFSNDKGRLSAHSPGKYSRALFVTVPVAFPQG